MFDGMIDWFKGLFGGAAEEAVQGVSDTLGSGMDTAQETAQTFGEGAAGGFTEDAQAYGEEALGGVTESAQAYGEEAVGGFTESAGETVQGFQEQADTVSGIVEDPGGAATDAARDHLSGENN